MATIRRVIKVRNPRRGKVTRSKTTRRRKVTAVRNKKGRFVKKTARRTKLKRNTRSTTAVRRKRGVSRTRRTARRKNPVLIELGMLNPHKSKRRKNVAKKRINRRRKASNPRRRVARRTARKTYRRRRRTNPVVVVTRKRRNPVRRRRTSATGVRRRRRNSVRRRNPLGYSSGKSMLQEVGGVLVGVAATKFIPTLIPASVRAQLGSGGIMNIVITGAGAFAAGWLAKRFGGEAFGKAVLLGGLAQTGSVALTTFAPPELAARLALSGVGDILSANYVVPQNPIRAAAIAQMPAPTGNGGMGSLRRGGNFR